ncbi:MAG: T9SS type A sorting domain-containing protein [Ignavibacteria bacterium]|nr:T9SS type A sorting domain-containing protein [Ignavibacteria bacterium]MBT8392217.1 T9SS type A sorting domain-containing protein [Ignavibacteria bacterium]NNL20021.1 T9SS type A sorting domain-containing protein [Ignavibacteriaceae bacterium]
MDTVYFFANTDSAMCIDLGNPDPLFNDVEDPMNLGDPMWPALGSLTNDIGHFGGPNSEWCYWRWPMIYNPTSVENEVKLPIHISLEQNYPNPFNPSTTIKYGITDKSFVELRIYDVLGREVVLLVNEEQDAGYYELNFNASSLSSGVYLYQLKAGEFIETKKMLLLK